MVKSGTFVLKNGNENPAGLKSVKWAGPGFAEKF